MHLIDEIQQQPNVLRELITRERATTERIAAAIRAAAPAYVVIAARGTSDNAARYAQYVFGALANLPVALAAPSLHTLYEAPPRYRDAVVLGISQSGQAADVLRVVEDARQQGAVTITITNDPESPLARAADFHLWLGADVERSVAATKTYTAQLAAIALIAAALDASGRLSAELALIPDSVQAMLHALQAAPLDHPDWVERYRFMERFAVLGRGYNYCTAYEINLKISELCYISGSAYSEADFRHGPIATVGEGYPVILVAPNGFTLPVMRDLLRVLKDRSAEIIAIAHDSALLEQAQRGITLPEPLPEWLSPIVCVIPGQVFALRLALACGYPVDQPRGLNKVTITR